MNITMYTPSTDQQREAAAKIVRQNVRMAIGNEPFFGTKALQLPWIPDETCPTMATDGTCVVYNPGFVLAKSAEEVMAVSIHEIMHVALLHPLRLNGRDPVRANMAMDYAINILLVDAGYKLPEGALIDRTYEGMSWEQIYDLLPPQPKRKGNGSGPGRDYSNGDVLNPKLSPEDAKKLEEHIQGGNVQAEAVARVAGKMPGNLRDVLLKSREPEEDYRHLFEKFVAPIYPRDYTWQRPSRRFIGQDMYLPSVLKDGVGELMVAVDTSGSISHDVMENFVGMINHFLTRVKPEKLHVVYCDASVYKHDQFKPGAPMELDGCKVQSGGTRFSPVFKYAQDNEIKPKCCVYLTDLECYDFGPEPEYPVLWMQYGGFRGEVPFGQIVKIKTVRA